MGLLNVERDAETIIDYKLKNLAWEDHPYSANRTVWKQSVKTDDQKKKLGRKPSRLCSLSKRFKLSYCGN